MSAVDLEDQKRVEFYAASVNAWYASALEHDKSVFALAGGGIAILVTLLTTVGFSTWKTFVLFATAIASFLIALVALLTIFRKNQAYIEKTLTSSQPFNDPSLKRLDLVALVAFGVGVLFASAVGFSSAFDSFTIKRTEKEKTMATENKDQQPVPVPLHESVHGAGRLQPDAIKSFHGAGNLQPTAATPVASTPLASTPAATTPAVAPIASAQAASTSAPATPAAPLSSSKPAP